MMNEYVHVFEIMNTSMNMSTSMIMAMSVNSCNKRGNFQANPVVLSWQFSSGICFFFLRRDAWEEQFGKELRYLFHCIRFCEILTVLGHGGSGTKFSALPRACVEHVPHAISGHQSSLDHQHGVHAGRRCGAI